jgi:RHS repeat-associated protein
MFCATTALAEKGKEEKVDATLLAPVNGALYTAPAAIALRATATAKQKSHPIVRVEFFQGTSRIGSVAGPVRGDQYSFNWTNVPPGTYILRVKATNEKGDTDVSDSVTVTVNPALNVLPTVSLMSPAANTIVHAPAAVTVTASASDSDGAIQKVDFYQGTTLIGSATTAPYSFAWTDIQSGNYILTAVATDNLGATATSAPVPILVNAVPSVAITSPSDNALFVAPADIPLAAKASDLDGSIVKVEFFYGATLIATRTEAPFTFIWPAVPSGTYSLVAVATDNHGTATTSAPIPIAVDAAPTVSLTSPVNSATFTAPANIPLTAQALDIDGTIAKVEFFLGATLIATRTSPPYSIVWTDVPQGDFALTAKATDNLGISSISAPISISVRAAELKAYFIHTDHNDTPRRIYDDQQRLVWSLDHQEPFGSNLPNENPSGLGTFKCNLRFPGQYFDSETGLNYNYFRDFDPNLGRYITSDPLGVLTSSRPKSGIRLNHLYLYVGGDPLHYYDPFGQDRWGDRDKDPWYPESGGAPPFPTRPDGQPWGWGCGDKDTDHLIPDVMWGVNVTPACRNHDRCYERACEPGVTKKKCDDDFYDDVVSTCRATGKPLPMCRSLAWQYQQGPKVGGNKSFDREKSKCC